MSLKDKVKAVTPSLSLTEESKLADFGLPLTPRPEPVKIESTKPCAPPREETSAKPYGEFKSEENETSER